MNFEELTSLLAQFDQSTLTSFKMKEENFELSLKKQTLIVDEVQPVTTTTSVMETTPSVTPRQPSDNGQTNHQGTIVRSPIVGVVYLQPAPDQSTFKQVGEMVQPGETLCIIEAMKLMNEITSEVSGEIIEVLVENEAVVEFDQPLFKIAEKRG